MLERYNLFSLQMCRVSFQALPPGLFLCITVTEQTHRWRSPSRYCFRSRSSEILSRRLRQILIGGHLFPNYDSAELITFSINCIPPSQLWVSPRSWQETEPIVWTPEEERLAAGHSLVVEPVKVTKENYYFIFGEIEEGKQRMLRMTKSEFLRDLHTKCKSLLRIKGRRRWS